MRRYAITNATFKNYYTATCQETNQTYHGRIRIFPKRNAPNLTIHRGPDKSSPVAALVHYPAFSRSWKIGFCAQRHDDPNLLAVEWEDVTSLKHSNSAKWQFTISVPITSTFAKNSNSNYHHQQQEPSTRRVFVWTRTRNVGINGVKPSSKTQRHWKLHEEEKEQARGEERIQKRKDAATKYVAIFTGDPARGKCGTLEIYEEFCDEGYEKLFISLLGLYELARVNE